MIDLEEESDDEDEEDSVEDQIDALLDFTFRDIEGEKLQ